jgi:hypothetical protein
MTVAPVTEPVDLDAPKPLVSHYRGISRFRALCGHRLIGVPAPDSAPLCDECRRLWELLALERVA